MDWNRIVVEALANIAEYLSIHMYVSNREDNYADYMGTSVHIERYMRTVRGIIAGAGYHAKGASGMKVCFDEWNATPTTHRDEPHMGLYTLEDALVVGMFLNAFIRNADLVKIANMAQLVNVIPPMVTKPDGMFLQTIFFPLELFANHNGSVALDAYVDCETFESEKHGKVPCLDVSASFHPQDRTVTVNMINRDKDNAAPVTLEVGPESFAGTATLCEVTGDGPKATNSFDEPANVETGVREMEVNGSDAELELPPCSVTVLKARLGS